MFEDEIEILENFNGFWNKKVILFVPTQLEWEQVLVSATISKVKELLKKKETNSVEPI